MNDKKVFLQELLTANNVVVSIILNLNKLTEIIPEISKTFGFEHKHPHHHLNVWEHTLYALSLSPNNFDIRLILLLHDIGKPVCFTEVDGVRHFKNHPEVSSKISRDILTRLGYDNSYVDYVCNVILLHDTPLTKDYISLNKQLSTTIFEVQKCDALAHNPNKNEKRIAYIQQTTKLLK